MNLQLNLKPGEPIVANFSKVIVLKIEVSYKPKVAYAKQIGLISQQMANLFNLGTYCEFSSVFVNALPLIPHSFEGVQKF